MAEKSGFFNSVNGDRKYKADFFAEFLASFIGNGVYSNPSTNLQVISNDSMAITIKQGKAWINGRYYNNDSDFIEVLDNADGVLNRIDRVVLRYDKVNREIKIVVKKGVFANSPVAPILTRDADYYELGIADVYVGQGAVSITQANITDLRLDNNLCGIVTGTIDQVDVTTLYNQYATAFAEKETEFEADFNVWFDTIKDALDGDVAGNLLNKINENTTSISDLGSSLKEKANQTDLDELMQQVENLDLTDTSIQITDTSNHFTATTLDGALSELFTNANDGKTVVANAVTAKGVSASGTDTFSVLASKIEQIETAKKSATFTPGYNTYTDTGGYSYLSDPYTFSGLAFEPSSIIVRFEIIASISGNSTYEGNFFGTFARHKGESTYYEEYYLDDVPYPIKAYLTDVVWGANSVSFRVYIPYSASSFNRARGATLHQVSISN